MVHKEVQNEHFKMTSQKPVITSQSEKTMDNLETERVAVIFGHRINQVLDNFGYPRKGTGRNVALAEEFNVTVSASRKWIEGIAIPTYDKLVAMCRKFNISIDWVLGNDDYAPPAQMFDVSLKAKQEELQQQLAEVNKRTTLLNKLEHKLKNGGLGEDTLHVPVFDAGMPDHTTLKNAKTIPLPTEWVKMHTSSSKNDVAVVQVNSDAMAPTLKGGDMVLIDMAVNGLQENAVYVLRFGSNTMIRRIQPRLDGTADIICDNANYKVESIPLSNIEFNTSKSIDHQSESNKLVVIGKTLWAIKRSSSLD